MSMLFCKTEIFEAETGCDAVRLGKSASSIALSADGSIVLLGEPNNNGGIGAAWVLARTGGGDY
jgi:hypothetical protein